jgi:hypothetical protein
MRRSALSPNRFSSLAIVDTPNPARTSMPVRLKKYFSGSCRRRRVLRTAGDMPAQRAARKFRSMNCGAQKSSRIELGKHAAAKLAWSSEKPFL